MNYKDAHNELSFSHLQSNSGLWKKKSHMRRFINMESKILMFNAPR